MTEDRRRRTFFTFLRRHRGTVAIAVVVAVASSSSGAAVSYLVLGSINTAAKTTTLRSGVNGSVLLLTNTNTGGGTSAKGLRIEVPAGRAPLTVNPGAGKATNLNADKLDGVDATAFARGNGVHVVANRMVLGNGQTYVTLLELGGLGTLTGHCPSNASDTYVRWTKASTDYVDLWENLASGNGSLTPQGATTGPVLVAFHQAGTTQAGDTLHIGQGGDGGLLRTATVTLAAYRSALGAACGLQATATLWTGP